MVRSRIATAATSPSATATASTSDSAAAASGFSDAQLEVMRAKVAAVFGQSVTPAPVFSPLEINTRSSRPTSRALRS